MEAFYLLRILEKMVVVTSLEILPWNYRDYCPMVGKKKKSQKERTLIRFEKCIRLDITCQRFKNIHS